MKLSFDDISTETVRYSITDNSWFDSREEVRLVSSSNEMWLRKMDGETVHLKGRLDATVQESCSRCGEPTEQSFHCDFFYRLILRTEPQPRAAEMEVTEEDSQTVYLSGSVIDFGELLREQVFLNLPMSALCREDCPGLCSLCGADLAEGTCGCATKHSSSPFAVLGKLLDK